MASLPTPGSDTDTWGDELNTYLSVEHSSTGYHSTFANDITFSGNVGIGVAAGSTFAFQVYGSPAGQLDAIVSHAGSGTGDMARMGCRDVGASSTLIEHYCNSYVGTGVRQAGVGAIFCSAGSGLSLCAENAAGHIRFYTGGDTSAQLHAYFDNAGSFTFKNTRQMLWEDSGGSARAVLQVYSDDCTYLDSHAGSIYFRTSAGTTQFFVDSTGNLKGKSASMACLQAVASSASYPTFSFIDDYDTGIYRSAADELSVATNGVLRMSIGNSVFKVTNIPAGSTQVGSGAGVDELWVTASHATLPDNVVMIGV